MSINAWGANFRSRFLKIPFGDQAFLLRRKLWEALGRFPVGSAYGEDHLFVWAARRAHIAVIRLPAEISTSARKYTERGWLATTAKHLLLTARQAVPEYIDLERGRSGWRTARPALAIFVKTPGLSPTKTRLAHTSSVELAKTFYDLSIDAMEGLGSHLTKLGIAQAYWAIAEEAGMGASQWRTLPHIAQGEGELGERLSNVYLALLRKHRCAILIGCDSPQLSAQDIRVTLDELQRHTFVVGPALDGGFYLFAGKQALPLGFWTNIRYSEKNTSQVLVNQAECIGSVKVLEAKTDVDCASDIKILRKEIRAADGSHFPQKQRSALDVLQTLDARFDSSSR